MQSNEAVERIVARIPKGVAAIYRVGIDDGSPLADFDVVIALERGNSVPKQALSGLGPVIDVRAVLDVDAFIEHHPYFPYAEWTLLYGRELRTHAQDLDSRRNLIRLGTLFFTGFLRNFYVLRDAPRNREWNAAVLRHVNDFAYARRWLPELPPELDAFIDEITALRKRYPDVEQETIARLLDAGIEHAWRLVSLLNAKLKDLAAVRYPPYFFTGREPTIFVPASAETCRMLTEQRPRFLRRLRLGYLPLGFHYIFAEDSFIVRYALRNTKHPRGEFKVLAKRIVKQIALFLSYLHFITIEIDQVFDAQEAYSVKQAQATYGASFHLLPAERAAFERLHLPKDAPILDVGCGGGRTTHALIAEGYTNVIGIDSDPALIESAASANGGAHRDRFMALDVRELDEHFKDGQFACILFSYNGLDYLYPYATRAAALIALHRKLQPGGRCILSSHNSRCINRAYLVIFLKNMHRILLRKRYVLADQTFGKLLTYFSPPRELRREIEQYGFKLETIVPNVLTLFPYRDPFPYHVFVKL